MASLCGTRSAAALYVGAQTWHGATLPHDLRRSRLVALSALVIGCTVTRAAPAYLAAAVAAAIIVATAAFEDRHPGEDTPAKPIRRP